MLLSLGFGHVFQCVQGSRELAGFQPVARLSQKVQALPEPGPAGWCGWENGAPSGPGFSPTLLSSTSQRSAWNLRLFATFEERSIGGYKIFPGPEGHGEAFCCDSKSLTRRFWWHQGGQSFRPADPFREKKHRHKAPQLFFIRKLFGHIVRKKDLSKVNSF